MKINNLSFKYDNKVVFNHLNLDLNEDRIYLMAKSGEGKTTLLRLIAGLIKPDSGYIDNEYKKIAMMFQEDRLLKWLNVKDNLMIINDDEDRVNELLKICEVDGSLNIDELSGGMARRIALIRALLYDGDLLLLDEPFSGMDNKLKAKMADLILKNNNKIIASGHDEKEAELLKAKIVSL